MSWFLQHIVAERYGALANRRIGPFAPGLNVVYGPNEAGKSTTASLVGGVLFGWEEARGVLNTYRPETGERAGSLEFAAQGEIAADRPVAGTPATAATPVADGLVAGGAPATSGLVRTANASTTIASLPVAARLSRRGQEPLQGYTDLLQDIDRATYRTIFWLNSDELRTLRSSGVTARLLTAGSGTGSSPSEAYVEIEQHIAALTANANPVADPPAGFLAASVSGYPTAQLAGQQAGQQAGQLTMQPVAQPTAQPTALPENTSASSLSVQPSNVYAYAAQSVRALAAQLEEKQAQIVQAEEQAKLLKRQHRELQELQQSRAEAAGRIEQLNREIEDLALCRSQMESVSKRAEQCRETLADLRQEHAGFAEGAGTTVDERLLSLNPAAERVLHDRLDEFSETLEKAQRIADTAKENATASTAAYEALVELDEDEDEGYESFESAGYEASTGAGQRAEAGAGEAQREGASLGSGAGEGTRTAQRTGARKATRKKKRRRTLGNSTVLAATSAVSTAVFAVAGIYLFMHGRAITSLSFTALGIGLIVMAFFLAAGAIVALTRPSASADSQAARLKDAQWVMLQDCKKRDSSQAEVVRVEADIASFLEENGLAAASGSLRQARSLLAQAREERSALVEESHRLTSIGMRIDALEDELAELDATRMEAARAVGLPADATLRMADDLARQKSGQRDALLQVADGMSMRYGELGRTLQQAREDRSFDALKLEAQLIRTRLREGRRQLVELLLAKRMMERSIAAWESRNQPEVYAQASRLLGIMTEGAWVKVGLSASGSLVACAADGTTRKPRHLSSGTCQQLYLSLRIALLMCADDVGRAVPVIADDILVNFDAARRSGAARVLAELAKKRQVIVMTCHTQTVAALQEAAPACNLVTL